jgi:hypothetical protein
VLVFRLPYASILDAWSNDASFQQFYAACQQKPSYF